VVVQPVVDEVLRRVEAGPGTRILDIGCGTGTLALPLSRAGSEVVAVDVSAAMIQSVAEAVEGQDLAARLDLRVGSAEALDLPADSLDAVVTNYALHHLRDPDKVRLVEASFRWLKPGGRLIIGDMMFGRGATAEDRRIIGQKVLALARKGPGGWWRVAKNGFRFLTRTRERPLPAQRWLDLLGAAGFTDLAAQRVVSEACVVCGVKPPAPDVAAA
jgi:SAM-dependent methyltransferase